MTKFRLKSIEIDNLWGWRSTLINFDPRVNILIGRNGSGKTSILHLIRHAVSGEIHSLSKMEFSELKIQLESFDGINKKSLRFQQTEDALVVTISRKKTEFPLEIIQSDRLRSPRIRKELFRIKEELKKLVPNVWLPVSRRLDFSETHDDYEARRPKRIESVDERLRHLLERLQGYRLRLESLLSNLYKQFECDVLRLILYDKEVDEFRGIAIQDWSEDDRHQLTQAFKEAGLYDETVQKGIDDHFERASKAVNELSKADEAQVFEIDHVMLIPLMKRTKSIIALSRQLESDKAQLFAPIHQFENIVSEYFTPKNITVDDTGSISILPSLQTTAEVLTPDHLSSGEKQILILLIQALLNERRSVVYMADEPELSLHVEWQEKLLSSILSLAGDVQLIVATHSPDVVSEFGNKVINLDSPE